MIISVINHTVIDDETVQRVLRAVNRQIEGDSAPDWSPAATLRLEGRSTRQPAVRTLNDMRDEAVLYPWDTVDVDDALGDHDPNHHGIPFGFVFTALSKALGTNRGRRRSRTKRSGSSPTRGQPPGDGPAPEPARPRRRSLVRDA